MTATSLDTDVITGLDFEPTLPCEHSGHGVSHPADGPATWIMASRCPRCGHAPSVLICESGRARLSAVTLLRCNLCCNHVADASEFNLHFLPIGVIS